MKKDLFRKESLEGLRSPEKLDEHLQVTNTSVWIVLIAILLLVVGFVVWSLTAHISGEMSPFDLMWK